MKYGFEKEYWVVKGGTHLALVPDGIPKDECGYLAEARGDPHTDPEMSAALFRVAETRLYGLVLKLEGLYSLDSSNATMRPNKQLLYDALRLHGKPTYPQGRGNIYGLDYKPSNRDTRAALHVHFSDQYEDKNGAKHCRMIDMPKYIQALDTAFAKQIKDARRLPGFYEMKPHGFEYRSLPCNVDPFDVAKVLLEIK